MQGPLSPWSWGVPLYQHKDVFTDVEAPQIPSLKGFYRSLIMWHEGTLLMNSISFLPQIRGMETEIFKLLIKAWPFWWSATILMLRTHQGSPHYNKRCSYLPITPEIPRVLGALWQKMGTKTEYLSHYTTTTLISSYYPYFPLPCKLAYSQFWRFQMDILGKGGGDIILLTTESVAMGEQWRYWFRKHVVAALWGTDWRVSQKTAAKVLC